MKMPSVMNLHHMQAALARIDALIAREVHRWQHAGQDTADDFRGLYVSDAQADALLARPFGTSWGQMISLDPTDAQRYAEAQARADRERESLAQTLRNQGETPRLEQLAVAFGLDSFDVDVLLICLAPTLDLRYERLCGYLQDDVTRKRPTINLILDLLCEPGNARLLMLSHFTDDAPLFRHHLLERVHEPGTGKQPLLSQTLFLDETIVTWLLGNYQPHAELRAHATLSSPQEDETDVLLTAEVWKHLEHAVPGESIVIFYGSDQATQQAAARRLAAHAGRPLLTVDLEVLSAAGLGPQRILQLALRDARMTSAIPCLVGWDACLTDGVPSPNILTELFTFPGMVIAAGRSAWHPGGIVRERTVRAIEFPIPTFPQRHALWAHFLGQAARFNLAALAGQFLLSGGQIRDAVATAKDRAAQRGEPIQEQGLFAAARIHSNTHLASLARKIVPRYDWRDIVLPTDQLDILREVIATVRARAVVLSEWKIGEKLVSSAGITVLFAGPPGTGKTMAAEIIARELKLDLYKIDLSTIVSKYIGETEKNLERIFREAEASNAILFFDEADALFGKRSEVRDSHDRYANIEISYLLQRMEAYEGVTILATNLRSNLDEAFTRRLQFAVDFPFPDEADRLRIWQALFPPEVPRDANLDLALLARRFKLAGGSIRNIIVSAAYLAAADGRRVTMEHLLHSTRRELQKMGRLVGEEDLIDR